MCGIFGYAGYIHKQKQETAWRFLRNLARESEVRGADSTGFSCRYSDSTFVSDKIPLRASSFVLGSSRFKKLKYDMPQTFIGHTRLGTGSSPQINNNNHPFFGNYFNMVHNGVIPSWRSIQKTHNLSMTSETDSEVALRLIENHYKDKSIQNSVEWLLENVWGNMAIALLDKRAPNIWLFRNENPIHVFKIPKRIFGDTVHFFCSLDSIFAEAWKRTFKNDAIKDGVEIKSLDDNKLFSISTETRNIGIDGYHKFIAYNLNVKSKFVKGAQYTNDYYCDTQSNSGATIGNSFFSTIVNPFFPQRGCTLPERVMYELRQKIKSKDSEKNIRIDGCSPKQYAFLRALTIDLFKIETDGNKDVQNIRAPRKPWPHGKAIQAQKANGKKTN